MMVALSAVALATIAAGAVGWALAFNRLYARLPLVPWSSRRPVPWGLFDLLIVVALYVVGLIGSTLVAHQLGWLPADTDLEKLTLNQRQLLTLLNVGVSVFVMVASLPLVVLRSGASLRDLGWSRRDLVGDLKVGLMAFAMLAPPVYALQGLLVTIWKPSKHPLMELFKGTPDGLLFAILVLAAVIIAPIFEELVFRVLLQGFLEKLVTFTGEAHEVFFGSSPHSMPPVADTQPAVMAEAVLPLSALPPAFADPQNPYAASLVPAPPEAQPVKPAGDSQPELRGWQALLPIAISSLIFALLHYSHGPDWVALTLLAAGMGYVYQRTHRLLPSLIVHVLLNGFSMWAFWIQVYEGPGAIADFGFWIGD